MVNSVPELIESSLLPLEYQDPEGVVARREPAETVMWAGQVAKTPVQL